jgi:hypothetical protein
LVEVLGAEAFEDVDVCPMGGGRPVVKQAVGGEDQRAGAHRHDDPGVRCRGRDVVDQSLVAARGEGGLSAAGDDDGEGRRRVVEGVARGQLDDGVGRLDVGVLDADDDLEGGVDAWQWSERLERSDEVEGVSPGYRTKAIWTRSTGATPPPGAPRRQADFEQH